jgi:parallel beta-helix repeat protein/predicted outer membrane repeat protein
VLINQFGGYVNNLKRNFIIFQENNPMKRNNFFLNLKSFSSIFHYSLFITLFLLFTTTSAFAEVVYVDKDATGLRDGSSWINACTSIRGGITASTSSDEIWVAAGRYNEAVTLRDDVTLYAGFLGTETTLSERDFKQNITMINVSKVSPGYHAVIMDHVSNTTLDGFTITGGKADGSEENDKNGGGIYCHKSYRSNLINNCIITGNSAEVYGGGVFLGEFAQPTITNCTISDNMAPYTGGLYCDRYSQPAIINCTISDNSGRGVYCSHFCQFSLVNCIISKNTSTMSSGGGVLCMSDSQIMITNCEISENSVLFSGDGAGVYCGSDSIVTITGSTISWNRIGNGWGGGVYSKRGGNVTITDSTIMGNISSAGGGIVCLGNPVISNCVISGNYAYTEDSKGGGIYCYKNSKPEISNCTISNNSVSFFGDGGGLYFDEDSEPIITNCTISRNSAKHSGGGIYCYEKSKPTITNCTISGNIAYGDGGGVYCKELSSPVITNCIIWGNIGREIYNESFSPDISYSCIQDGWSGAGNMDSDPKFIAWGAQDYYIDAANTSFADGSSLNPFPDVNHALTVHSLKLASDSPCIGSGKSGVNMGSDNGVGGAAGNAAVTLNIASGDYDLSRSLLVYWVSIQGAGEEKTTLKGTVTGLRSECFLKDVKVTGGKDSGIKIARGESPLIENCTVSNNSAYQGGGIFCSGDPAIKNCTISGNSSYNGGGIFCDENAGPSITDCTIRDNIVDGEGGGVYCYNNSEPVFTRCTVYNNYADKNGGGVYCDENSKPIISNCTISANSTDMKGSGLYCNENSQALITNCTIWGNRTIAEGGGIYCNESQPIIKNCIIRENEGGAILNLSGTVDVSYSCIEGGWSGTGNIDSDPKFTAWSSSDYYFDAANSDFADGSSDHPFRDILSVFYIYDIKLSSGSPCIGTGEGGVNMGSYIGTGEDVQNTAVTFHIASGEYSLSYVSFDSQVSIQGAGEKQAILNGTVYGLRTGCFMKDVKVTGAENSGIRIAAGESPFIENCTISQNNGILGGGVYCEEDSMPTFTNCTISNNIAEENGGGVYCSGNTTIDNSTISENSAHYGGGVCASSEAIISNCMISTNNAKISGGGVYCLDYHPEIKNSVILENTSSSGGGVFCKSTSDPIITNCTVSRNRSDRSGGGVYCDSQSKPEITNCTILENNSSSGLGVFCNSNSLPLIKNCTIINQLQSTEAYGVYCYNSQPIVTNCIIWGNGGFNTNDFTNVTYSCIENGRGGTGNIDSDPRFIEWGTYSELYIDAANNDAADGSFEHPFPDIQSTVSLYSLKLASNSPCIGTGESGVNMGSDTGIGGTEFSKKSTFHIASGNYDLTDISFGYWVSIEGEGEQHTTLNGTVYGLRSGCFIKDVKVTGAEDSGIKIAVAESPEIEDCTISGNRALRGGGVFCDYDSSPSIINCTISSNSSSNDGGGIYCEINSNPAITECMISCNSSSDDGGALFCRNSHADINYCTISCNSSNDVGGGIYCGENSRLNITNSIISANAAGSAGGGIYYNNNSQSVISNCIISGNRSNSNGGALYCTYSDPLITNCTISGNIAENAGDGVYCSFSELNIMNSIIWGNGSESVYNTDGNPKILYSCIENRWFDEGNIDSDPLFVDAGSGTPGGSDWINGDYHLQDSSLCIDAGNPNEMYDDICMPPGKGTVLNDMGAYGGPDNWGWLEEVSHNIVSKHIIGKISLRSEHISDADANSDGKIDIADVIMLIRQGK